MIRIPDLHCPVPGRGEERVFRDEVPVHAEDFAGVFGPGLDRKLCDIDVEELHATVAARSQDLRFVGF